MPFEPEVRAALAAGRPIDMARINRRAREWSRPFRVTDGKGFRLDRMNPADTLEFDAEDKPLAKEALEIGVDALSEYQEMLYAQDRWSLLLIFQAMDAAGKDGAIAHVMSGVNPQGCQVHSFKAPSAEELDHDWMWRCLCRLPERGRIGIFNRSYYEETLVVRVHPGILQGQKLPRRLVTRSIWKQRFEDIRNIEQYLTRNGTVVRKFFLHVSKEEQKRRFLARIDEPEKNWKFSDADVKERTHWDDYMTAYQDVIRQTSSPEAPWYVVPADNKWFTRLVIAGAVIDTLASLGLHFPEVSDERRVELGQARNKLLREKT